MKSPLKALTKPVLSLLKLSDKLVKPPLDGKTGYVQQELDHERNKVVVRFYLAVTMLVIVQMIVKKFPLTSGSVMIAVNFLQIAFLIFSCRYNMNIFKFYFSIVISFSGPIIMFFNTESGQRAWLASQMYPTLVFLCTGSVRHFLFQAALQIVLKNFAYQTQMLHYLEFTTPEDFLRTLTRNSTTLSIANVVIILCLDTSLKKAYNKIQQIEKKKEESEKQRIFLLSFSHELRNIINSLMGNVKLASLEIISDQVRNFLKNADVCAESLLHLINNILDSGKVEIGELEINPTPTNIYKTMDQIWRIYSQQIKGKRLQGSLKFLNSIPETLQVDHYRLMQIFFNLIGNAIKFTDKGSINITVGWIEDTEHVNEKHFEPCPFEDQEDELSEGILDRSHLFSVLSYSQQIFPSYPSRGALRTESDQETNMNKGVLKVTIMDTGNGIPNQDIAKLFQKFSQVSSDPSKRKLGTGLGLFITKELCERMGGRIKVFSKEGKGSCFMFCIPIKPLPSETLDQSLISTSARTKKLRALITDDEILGRNILESFFSKLQVEVANTALNGYEAYKMYMDSFNKGERLDLVTMDLTMPVMDGKKSAEKIRKFEKEKGIEPCLLLIVSGNCSESEITECMNKDGKIRANFFLKKPASLDEIARVISQCKKE